MRDVALMLGLGLMLNAPLSQGAEDPNWAQIQYQEAQQTEDPVLDGCCLSICYRRYPKTVFCGFV